MQQIHGVGERPLSPGRLRTSLRIKSDKRAAPRHAHGLDQEKQRATHAERVRRTPPHGPRADRFRRTARGWGRESAHSRDLASRSDSPRPAPRRDPRLPPGDPLYIASFATSTGAPAIALDHQSPKEPIHGTARCEEATRSQLGPSDDTPMTMSFEFMACSSSATACAGILREGSGKAPARGSAAPRQRQPKCIEWRYGRGMAERYGRDMAEIRPRHGRGMAERYGREMAESSPRDGREIWPRDGREIWPRDGLTSSESASSFCGYLSGKVFWRKCLGSVWEVSRKCPRGLVRKGILQRKCQSSMQAARKCLGSV